MLLDELAPENSRRSLGPSTFQLTVPHCLAGLERAVHFGWFDLDTFDPDEYEHYERVENGDFNWIVPGFFLSFSGPTQTPIAYVDGVKTNTPETYFDYYRKNGITGIIRFNNKVYDRKKFLDAGFNHTSACPARDPRGAAFFAVPCRGGGSTDGGEVGGSGRGGGMGAAGPPNVWSPYSPPAAAPPLAMCDFLAGGQGPERRLAKRGVGWACRLRV